MNSLLEPGALDVAALHPRIPGDVIDEGIRRIADELEPGDRHLDEYPLHLSDEILVPLGSLGAGPEERSRGIRGMTLSELPDR
jgi:hypothetical protein